MNRPQPQQVASRSLSVNRAFLRSLPGVLRLLQLLAGTGLWITIASHKYDGNVHFVLFVAVFFWLLTLALYFLTLLDKQDLVPVAGGERWLLTNAVHDLLASCLYAVAAGLLVAKTQQYSYCNLETYRLPCAYNVYLAACALAALGCALYLASALYLGYRKCRQREGIV
uniref:MARVEL domain-containing protein 1 n=1 Tax=Geotrypetes seraphini TaxID=260995 RepID=A0A6P8QNZ0_GEOSA|nr:MARVEL domain-containing protein 1 [Geotrypetes seraphini]